MILYLCIWRVTPWCRDGPRPCAVSIAPVQGRICEGSRGCVHGMVGMTFGSRPPAAVPQRHGDMRAARAQHGALTRPAAATAACRSGWARQWRPERVMRHLVRDGAASRGAAPLRSTSVKRRGRSSGPPLRSRMGDVYTATARPGLRPCRCLAAVCSPSAAAVAAGARRIRCASCPAGSGRAAGLPAPPSSPLPNCASCGGWGPATRARLPQYSCAARDAAVLLPAASPPLLCVLPLLPGLLRARWTLKRQSTIWACRTAALRPLPRECIPAAATTRASASAAASAELPAPRCAWGDTCSPAPRTPAAVRPLHTAHPSPLLQAPAPSHRASESLTAMSVLLLLVLLLLLLLLPASVCMQMLPA
jgi:hypothetical protein